jgi:siroheme synthase-like protein
MRYLPVGLDVRDRTCIVVGAGSVGTRKVTNLLRAGAAVVVVSPEATGTVALHAEEGRILWKKRDFLEEDIEGAFLVVAATDDVELNTRLGVLSRERGILICDSSSAERSQVIFGAVHQSHGVTLSVFTDGKDPSRARQTRDRIAELEGEWNEG